MPENTSKNYSMLKSSRTLNALGLGIIALGFVIWPINDFVRQDKSGMARRKAEILSYQLAQLYQENSNSDQTQTQNLSLRGPASVSPSNEQLVEFKSEGLLGSDPWGQAFEYKILNVDEKAIRLQIRSAGPDHKFSSAKVFESDSISQNRNDDDLTMVYQVPLATK